MQHYAALGRDVAGAAEVNLINADQVRAHFLS
jgi:DNA-directed RNA polymerase